MCIEGSRARAKFTDSHPNHPFLSQPSLPIPTILSYPHYLFQHRSYPNGCSFYNLDVGLWPELDNIDGLSDDFSLCRLSGDPWNIQSTGFYSLGIPNLSAKDPLVTELCDRSSGQSIYAEDNLNNLCLEDLSRQTERYSMDDIPFPGPSPPGIVTVCNNASEQNEHWNPTDGRSTAINGTSRQQYPYESLLENSTDSPAKPHLLPISRVVPAYLCTNGGCSASFVEHRQLV